MGAYRMWLALLMNFIGTVILLLGTSLLDALLNEYMYIAQAKATSMHDGTSVV